MMMLSAILHRSFPSATIFSASRETTSALTGPLTIEQISARISR